MNVNELARKARRVLKEEGAGMLIRKTRLYIKNVATGQKVYSEAEKAQKCCMDVLFINGCYLDHPSRYRVSHQREQLCAGNLSSAEVFYTNLSLDLVKNFRTFIFFRCPYTEQIGEFVKLAHSYNKTVLYDIDDLMVDTKYTETIPYVQTMSREERKVYDDGVIANGKLLSMCDGAITTTQDLAEELKHYVSEVYINRNVVSEEMIRLSETAREKISPNEGQVRVGYFSGSITHNPDFAIVLPALIQVMEKYESVQLLLVGELDIPATLEPYKSRITVAPMTQWRKLPELIASVDINIAPLEDTLFNRAKSENKWSEAALVKVPTLASNVGAFKAMIQNGETGLLCENTTEDWFNRLSQLVENSDLRHEIGNQAYQYVKKHCTTISASAAYSDLIYKLMKPNIVYILPVIQISGGALVALKHAEILQERGYDVTIFNDGYEKDTELESGGRVFPVISRRTIQVECNIDRCVATLWSTCDFFYEYGRIRERFYLVQNFETDFYKPGDDLRLRANASYRIRIPVKYITISKWCEDWLHSEYKIGSFYAPNGLDTERFYPKERNYSGKIRVLVEGNSDDYYKNVDESFRITNQLPADRFEVWYMSYQGKPKNWYRVDRFLHKVPYSQVPDVYRQCHILIKSSILESFSYPPLEMMATGGCVVVAPNGGNVEYLENERNCLFYTPGDEDMAVRQIKRIISDELLRKKLISEGIRTGQERNWNRIKEEIIALYEQ